MSVLPQKAFDANYKLKKQYGTYENYVNAMKEESSTSESNTAQPSTPSQPTSTQPQPQPKEESKSYTIDEIMGVVNEGEGKPKSFYKQYMDEATDIYNRSVAENNQTAQNQSAVANAQYREVERNINEINKANGMSNTGYEGDALVSAYNAYRNSVNEARANANKSNNELYNYYLQNMASMEQEEYNKLHSETGVLSTLANFVNNEDAYNTDGTIKSDTAEDIWKYVGTLYGGAENIPNEVKATLESTDGFTEWLQAYNEGNVDAYDEGHSKGNGFGKSTTTDGKTISAINSSFTTEGGGEGDSSHVGDTKHNNFRITYGGKVYYLETSKDKPSADEETEMKKTIKNAQGREAQEGDVCYYGGELYIVTRNGTMRKVEAREGNGKKGHYTDLLLKIKEDLGIE